MVPPTPSELLGWMHDDVEHEAQYPSIVFLGANEEMVVSPCVDISTTVTLLLLGGMVSAGEVPHPDWVAVISDTYAYQGEVMRTQDELEAMFAAKDPSVTESLHAICLAPDGPSYTVHQHYYRAEDGTVTWFEPKMMPIEETHGPIVAAMRTLLSGT